MLRLPILRYEWVRDDRVVARKWTIVDPERAMALVTSRLAEFGLEPPDRTIHVHGDRV